MSEIFHGKSADFETIGREDVTPELTVALQRVALQGWLAAMPDLPEDALRYQYNPDDEGHVAQRQRLYEEYTSEGGLTIAYAKQSDRSTPIGYITSYEIPPRSRVRSLFRPLLRPFIGWPTVIIDDIAVAPEHQRTGIGSELVHKNIGAGYRRALSREVGAFPPIENKPAVEFLQSLGLLDAELVIAESEARFGPAYPLDEAIYKSSGRRIDSALNSGKAGFEASE